MNAMLRRKAILRNALESVKKRARAGSEALPYFAVPAFPAIVSQTILGAPQTHLSL